MEVERHRARAVQGPERAARPRRRGARRERLRRRPRGRGHLPARLDPFRLQEARPSLLVHLARARAGADRPRPRQAPLRLRRPRRRRRGQGQGGLARGPQRLARPIVPLRRLAPVRRPRPDPDAGAGRRADPRDPRLQIGPLLPGGVLGRQDGARAPRRREAEDPSGGRAPRPCGRRVAVRDPEGRAQAGEVPRAQALRPHRAATRRIDARGPHRGGNAERAANAVREEAGDISQDREPLHRRVRHPRDDPRALSHRGAGNRRRGRRGRVRRVALRRRPRGRRLEGPRPRRDPAHGAARRQGDGQARWRRAPVAILICCRLMAATMDPATKLKTKVEGEINGGAYTASGSTVTDASWIAVDEACRDALRAAARPPRTRTTRRRTSPPTSSRATPSPSPMATFA